MCCEIGTAGMTELEPNLTEEEFETYVQETAEEIIQDYIGSAHYDQCTPEDVEIIKTHIKAGDIDISCDYYVSAEEYLDDSYVDDWDMFLNVHNIADVELLVGDVTGTYKSKAYQKFQNRVIEYISATVP